MSPLSRRLIGVSVALLAVLLVAWAIDTRAAGGGSPRNTRVGDVDVGRRTEAAVADVVGKLAVDFAVTPVVLTVGEREIRTTAEELALTVDTRATVAAVVAEADRGSVLVRPLRWVASLFTSRTVPVRYSVRPDALEQALDDLGASSETVVEPTLDLSDGVEVIRGQLGRGPDPDEVAEALLDGARSGRRPIEVTVDPVERQPTITGAAAEEAAETARDLTGEPFTVRIVDRSITFEPEDLRAWLAVQSVGDALEVELDEERILLALGGRIEEMGVTRPVDAGFTIDGGVVEVVPAVIGLSCCPTGTAGQIADALWEGASEVDVDGLAVHPDLTTEEAEALGVVEPVGSTTEWNGQAQVKSFTTFHACCEPRVTNIHRIADLVRGTVVLPGNSFSVNDLVGERTTEKGFVEAGAIRDGQHVSEVGGGVSQFATTLFNAAYFAGLPIDEYRAHSEHFSRYPYGREATMGWPDPDLVFTNDTPYGIVIWPTYTDTSVTVTLYSTQHAAAQQTGQSEHREGHCTVVTTQRTITYPDGRSRVDEFGARYRDDGATTC